jgi:hypothetical protein
METFPGCKNRDGEDATRGANLAPTSREGLYKV